MYEKFGLSLGQTSKYEINIIGFCVKNIPQTVNITFHPLFNFKRLNISRLAAPFQCLKKYHQLRPELIIINTHELLIVTFLYRILFGCKVAYDIQENYYRNILYTNTFPLLIKPFIAAYIRGKEYLSRLFVDHYFLAEKQYQNEFTFARGKCTVIENKYLPSVTIPDVQKQIKNSEQITLLFSGTIGESTGVFECIALTKKLHEINPEIRLNIIGYCAQKSTLIKLKETIKNSDFITLFGGSELVSHQEVLAAIQKADFGVVYYPTNKSTMNTMPTKLFEYLGNGLPMLLQDHEPWVELAEKYEACIPINIHTINPGQLLNKMKKRKFYTTIPKDEILWRSEEKKLIEIVNNLLI
ncbi:glycosyltransferase [Fulvivirga imtechensis AK7]|uniref:Glycosyltransferase n=2 Tax=Fulvivirga TaxID=396811 RepID=L8JJ29_9BACT|nr:glycosyltransferase [Fulvivirga imtechensis AK7]